PGSPLAVVRTTPTTPCLLGRCRRAILRASQVAPWQLSTQPAAWLATAEPPVADALAAVGRHLWVELHAPTLRAAVTAVKSPLSSPALLSRLIEPGSSNQAHRTRLIEAACSTASHGHCRVTIGVRPFEGVAEVGGVAYFASARRRHPRTALAGDLT